MKIEKTKLQEFQVKTFQTSIKKIIKGGSFNSCDTQCQGYMTCAVTRCNLH